MNKLKIFFHVFTKTISEPNYYNDVVRSKISFSLKYFFLFYIFLAIATSLNFSLKTLPQIKFTLDQLSHDLSTNYPDELNIQISQGAAQVTGVELPYQIPFPDYLSDQSYTDRLLTIDTQSNSADPDSLFTLTTNGLIFRLPDGTKQTLPLSDLGNEQITIERNTIQLATSAIQGRLDSLYKFTPLILFVLLSISFPVISLFSLLFLSLFTFFITKLLQKPLPYKKTYQIGLHTITFAEVVVFLENLLFPNIHFPQLFTIAFIGATILAVYSLKKIKIIKA